MRVALVLLALVLAGCAETSDAPPASDGGTWRLSGSFAAERTDADVEAVCRAGTGNATCAIMKSFPEQFSFPFATREACEAARARILQVPHVQAGECAREVSGAPASGPWDVRGSFTQDRTAEDIEALCRAATGNATCALMESFPEQFAFSFPTEGECAAARARMAAVPHVVVGECLRREASPDPQTPTASPPEEGAARELRVGTFALTWRDPDRPERAPREMEWEVVRAWEQDRLVTIETTTRGIEGGDFRFTLFYRPQQPHGGVTFHEAGATRNGTFDITYTEAVFWAGQPVTRVESVDPRSFVRVEQDLARGTAEGTFLLDLVGVCDTDGMDCAGEQPPRRRVLEGRFGA